MSDAPPPTSTPGSPLLDGSWEHSGRSPGTAAVLGLLGIGALYFNAQGILAGIIIAFATVAGKLPPSSGNRFETILEQIRFLADPIRFAVVISQYLFMLIPSLWLIKRWHSSSVRDYIRLTPASTVAIFLAILGTLAVIPASDFVAEQLVRTLGVPRKLLEINAEIFTSRSPGEFAWLIFVVCVTPAICEEIFFRGFVQRTFERTMGWKSVIVIGTLFGLFHFQPLGLVSLSMLGILFGYFFFRTKSLLPSMAAHFTNNLLAVSFYYRGSGAPASEASLTSILPGWFLLLSLPLAGFILFIFHQRTRPAFTQTT